MPNTTIYLKDYQPPTFYIDTVDLCFDLFDSHAQVTSTMTLRRRRPGPLQLLGEDLELISIKQDDKVLDATAYDLQEGCLLLNNCPDQMRLEIVTKIQPQTNTQLSGLYRSKQLFCTQCEAEGFRRITYFIDRPDNLAIFTTTIIADKKSYPVLLSNGNPVASGDSPNNRHWVRWEDPFKKPAYLFALVAGDLQCVTDSFTTVSGRLVELRIYVEPGNEDTCSHAMASVKKAMQWDEEVYGREYDLDIYMIVAVSDFNMGAMENKGLNIFNAKYILARLDTATDQDFAAIEGVVGHEYFHNWTGNRITCRDWFQLSLKEGLTVFRDQEFSRDMNSRAVNRIADVKELRSTQFPEDAGSMAHPVRPASYQEINNFYTATIYNKGAEVIRMQHTLLGAAGFRRGMDLYFERHDGQAVTIDDFVAAMADANQRDLSQFKLWYSQAGTPKLTVHSEYQDGCLTLSIEQSCPPTPECAVKQPFHIPIRIALWDPKGQILPVDNEVLELTEAKQRFVFKNIPQKPIVSLLRDFSAPVQLVDDSSEEDALFLLAHETDGFAKWEAGQRLILNQMKAGLEKPDGTFQISAPLLAAFKTVLADEGLDDNLKAELITPPSFEALAAIVSPLDVWAVEHIRDSYRMQLGSTLYPLLAQWYDKLWQAEDNSLEAKAYGRRSLRNVCLWLMMKAKESETIALCQNQFAKARTMTDQIASFALLAHSTDKQASQQAIAAFYQQWSKNDLVMDKWFAIQATAENPDTLVRVRELMQHPAFQHKNPNKVRALIGAFTSSNPRNFHALDGSGYAFLTQSVIQLDAINPQIAAKLATPFTRWCRLDKPRRLLIRQQLQQLVPLQLSSDLREVVEKSLERADPP